MMKKRWMVIGLASLLLVAIGSAGILMRGPAEGVSSETNGEVNQETLTNEVVRANALVRADASVVPLLRATLRFPVDGVVSEVLVSEGDDVEENQLLARLDASREQAAVARAEANLRQARARLDELENGPRAEETESAIALYDAAMARLAQVNEDGSETEIAIAEAEARHARAELDLTKAGARPEVIAFAQAELEAAQAALDQARAALADTEIRAPFAGIIAHVDLERGEFVTSEASEKPAVRLGDLSGWLLETEDLTELDVVHIDVGDTIDISFDALPDLQLSGRVISIRPLGEEKLGDTTYTVVIQPDTLDPRLRWNMTALIEH